MNDFRSNCVLAGPYTNSESGMILNDEPGLGSTSTGGMFSTMPTIRTLESSSPFACINSSSVIPYPCATLPSVSPGSTVYWSRKSRWVGRAWGRSGVGVVEDEFELRAGTLTVIGTRVGVAPRGVLKGCITSPTATGAAGEPAPLIGAKGS